MTMLNDFKRPEIIEMDESEQRYLRRVFNSETEDRINPSADLSFDPLLLEGVIDARKKDM